MFRTSRGFGHTEQKERLLQSASYCTVCFTGGKTRKKTTTNQTPHPPFLPTQKWPESPAATHGQVRKYFLCHYRRDKPDPRKPAEHSTCTAKHNNSGSEMQEAAPSFSYDQPFTRLLPAQAPLLHLCACPLPGRSSLVPSKRWPNAVFPVLLESV